MRAYLDKNIDKKLGVIRAGMPREVYFEAVLKQVAEDHAVFEDADGTEFAIPISGILLAGAPSESLDKLQPKAGFIF